MAGLLRAALLTALLLVATAAQAAAPCAGWSQWQAFKTGYLSDDGRVVDGSTAQKITVSEGQAYALFFALVANDRNAFDKILQWTENNLAQGDFTAHLPAWQWGRREDGSWGVLDSNPASDADLWIGYDLAEAGRLWNVRRYRILAELIGKRILREETAAIPGLGLSLLPGPVGFTQAPGQWRLNASYLPIQLLRGLQRDIPNARWSELIEPSIKLIEASAPQGYAADWMLYEKGKGFVADAQTQADGSYNAIRVYLWAGMLSPGDPARAGLLQRLQPMAASIERNGAPPEHVDIRNGVARGSGPVGFSAASIPFLAALGQQAAAQMQAQRLDANPPSAATAYYSAVLSLFGGGWHRGEFRFAADGTLLPRWREACRK
ncbi:MAG: cellulose synthase complex periplasmic endoglucanase BcsZ [Stenotrophobium sp.]